MNNFETIVNTLRCKIKRAIKEKKMIKSHKLKAQLKEIYKLKLKQMAKQKQLDEQVQNILYNYCCIDIDPDEDNSSENESKNAMAELVSLQDAELTLQIEKIANLNNNVTQQKLEAEMQQMETIAFDHENEQDKSNKSESEPEQLVSIQAGQVGNQIGAQFWEQELLTAIQFGYC